MSWEDRLSEPIALPTEAGRFGTLRTLRDAAEFLTVRFATRKSGLIDAAIEGLLAAAEDPTPAKVDGATDALETFLAFDGLIEGAKPRVGPGEDIPRRIAAMLAEKSRSRSRLDVGLRRRKR